MKYIIGIIISIIILIILFALYTFSIGRKKKNNSFTITVHEKTSSVQDTKYPCKIFEVDPIISSYFEELNEIKSLYSQRETNPNALQQCIDICYLNINTFPMVLEAMNYDIPKSTPAFERLSIILEKNHCYADAWEIAQIQAFFNCTENNINRVNRLTSKIASYPIDKSSGNIALQYHFDEIKKLHGELPQQVEKIFEIIAKAPFKFDTVSNFVDDYVVIDVETTGLNYHIDAIVEIGCIKFRNNKEVQRFNTLINPNTTIPPEAVAIHNITNDMVKNAPYIDEKLQELLDFISDDIIIGHNIGFDIRFVINACQWAFIPNPRFKTIDTLKLARKYINKSEIDDFSLDTIRKFLNINQTSHRALTDCEATAQLYQYCFNKEQNQ